MKPRPWPHFRVAFGPAVLATAAVLALTMAVPGPVSAQPSGGWKPGPHSRDAGSSPAGRFPAGRVLRTDGSLERSGFYSNLGLLESVSREAASAIADSLELPPGSAVTLFASTPHEANWFVGNIIGETLAERGYKVRILDWGSASAAGDSSGAPPPSPATPAHPNRPRPGGEGSSGGQSTSLPDADASNGDTKNEDGTTESVQDGTAPSDTTAADPDSTQSESDSVRGVPDGGSLDKASSGEESQSEEQPALSPEQPPGSAVTTAPGQNPSATSRTLPAGEVLDLRVVEFGVSYSDIGRKLLFGPLRFTRVGGVYLQVASRREPAGELRQVLSAERHRVDRLSGSQRALAEGASYPFKIPELKAPGLGRYIEPTVVVGIVSSLVYLFYANQSSK